MTIALLLVVAQSCGVSVSAEEFPTIVGQLCDKENSRPAIHIEGVHQIPLPGADDGISTTFSGEIDSSGKYSLAVSTPWESNHYWFDSKVAFAGKGPILELYHPAERAPMSVFLENALSPASTIVGKLFREARTFKALVEESTTREIAGRYEYSLKCEDSPDINLKIEINAEGLIEELRVSEVGGSPGVSVHRFRRYERINSDTAIPLEYEHRLEELEGKQQPSSPLVVARIELTQVSLAANDSTFSPDQTKFSDVRDYRRGIRKLEKTTGEWVDGVKEFFGF